MVEPQVNLNELRKRDEGKLSWGAGIARMTCDEVQRQETYQQVRAPPPQVLIEFPPFDAQSVWILVWNKLETIRYLGRTFCRRARLSHLFRSNRCPNLHSLLHRRCSSIAEWTVIPVWRHGSAWTDRTAIRRLSAAESRAVLKTGGGVAG